MPKVPSPVAPVESQPLTAKMRRLLEKSRYSSSSMPPKKPPPEPISAAAVERKGAEDKTIQRDLEEIEEYLAGVKACPGTLKAPIRVGKFGLYGGPLNDAHPDEREKDAPGNGSEETAGKKGIKKID